MSLIITNYTTLFFVVLLPLVAIPFQNDLHARLLNQAMTLLESICAQQRSIRKMKFLSCLFAVTWIIAQSAAAAPSQGQKPSADYVGVRLFLTEKGFGYLEEVAKELFVHDLQKITIPDITFDKDGFKGSLTSMKCTNAALNDLDLKATAGSI